jgi:SAM-dependent methyltransferase
MRGMIRTVLQSLRKPAAPAQPAMPLQPPGPSWAPEAPPPLAADGSPVYWPGIFEAKNLENAKEIALTPEKSMSTDERWDRETTYTVDLIAQHVPLGPQHRVFDFGCGAGRMSRALIERFGCEVVGIDQSRGMREQAVAYVGSPKFTVVSPQEFDAMVVAGYQAHFALACWSIQHCMHPAEQVARVANGLGMDAPFLLINSLLRLIPTNLGWRSDGEDVEVLMAQRFAQLERGNFPPEVADADVINSSFIAWWRRTV